MRKKRLREVIAYIEKHPEHWHQRSWHCNTTHCVAGFGELLAAGYNLPGCGRFNWDGYIQRGTFRHTKLGMFLRKAGLSKYDSHAVARKYFGLSEPQAEWLFAGQRTLEELKDFARTGEFPL